jgi:molybdenum cofactor biosynthesis protein B
MRIKALDALDGALASSFIDYPLRRRRALPARLPAMPAESGRQNLRVATITVSDTRTESSDEGGRKLRDLIGGAGFVLGSHAIVKDEPNEIRAAMERCSHERVEVIVLTGGTGIAPRDQTYEAVTQLLEKRLDGFGEAFRRLSWDAIGPKAILSRAVAGTWRGHVVAALPGSPAALGIAVTEVLAPVLVHAVTLLGGPLDQRAVKA